jgi:hypothetical protein
MHGYVKILHCYSEKLKGRGNVEDIVTDDRKCGGGEGKKRLVGPIM